MMRNEKYADDALLQSPLRVNYGKINKCEVHMGCEKRITC